MSRVLAKPQKLNWERVGADLKVGGEPAISAICAVMRSYVDTYAFKVVTDGHPEELPSLQKVIEAFKTVEAGLIKALDIQRAEEDPESYLQRADSTMPDNYYTLHSDLESEVYETPNKKRELQ